jgi:hypothetical protein
MRWIYRSAAWMSGAGGSLADLGMGGPAPCRILERKYKVQPGPGDLERTNIRPGEREGELWASPMVESYTSQMLIRAEMTTMGRPRQQKDK